MTNVLNQPLPVDYMNYNYLRRLPYAICMARKQYALKKRNKQETVTDLDNELCIFAPNQLTEFYRTTDIGKMKTFVASNPNPTIEIKIYAPTDIIGIRLGKAMQALLQSANAKLVLIDCMGETIVINSPIVNDLIQNKNYRR